MERSLYNIKKNYLEILNIQNALDSNDVNTLKDIAEKAFVEANSFEVSKNSSVNEDELKQRFRCGLKIHMMIRNDISESIRPINYE